MRSQEHGKVIAKVLPVGSCRRAAYYSAHCQSVDVISSLGSHLRARPAAGRRTFALASGRASAVPKLRTLKFFFPYNALWHGAANAPGIADSREFIIDIERLPDPDGSADSAAAVATNIAAGRDAGSFTLSVVNLFRAILHLPQMGSKWPDSLKQIGIESRKRTSLA